MILFVLTALMFASAESQLISEHKPQYNIKNSLIINALVQSNISSMAKLMNWQQPSQPVGCLNASLIGDGICDDGKINFLWLCKFVSSFVEHK